MTINYSTFTENIESYFDKVSDSAETIIITRNNEKSVVLISLDEWKRLQKLANNTEYLTEFESVMKQHDLNNANYNTDKDKMCETFLDGNDGFANDYFDIIENET